MSIFKKKKNEKVETQEVAAKKAGESTSKTAEKKESGASAIGLKAIESNLVLFPLLTEKSTDLQSENKYVFMVLPKANKSEIKKEIERLFSVHVENVNIIKSKPKQRRWRGIKGHRSGYKKAIVTIEKGKKIEILPA